MDIHIHDVTKSFGKQIAIDRVSFTINSSDICCLLGPSGSGKTTLIRLMIGALKADEGMIQLGETVMPSMDMFHKIGFMPQNDGLYDDLSGEANLEFFGSIYKLGKTKLQARITEVLTLVDLADDRKKLVRNFSGGMKKRLSLAIAIFFTMIVLEPFDQKMRQRILKATMC